MASTLRNRLGSPRATYSSRALSYRLRRLPLELALLFTMFMAYRAGRLLTIDHTSAAFANAARLWDAERSLHLPHEQAVQGWFLPHLHLMQALNVYYASVHFPATVAVLVYLFLRRPAQYLWVRRSMILLTAMALAGHVLFPLAPPRMLPDLGFVDTGATIGPDVYGSPAAANSIANQYAAMPSLHVGWALLIAIGLIAATKTRWRWLWLLHPLVTTVVVVATANHWWLDGAFAVVLLGAAVAVATGVERVRVSLFLRHERTESTARA